MPQLARTRDSLLGVLTLAVLGYGLLRWVDASRPVPPGAPPRELAPVAVAVRGLELVSVEPRVEGFGTLVAQRRARIAAEVGARIVRVHPGWRVGALVEEGEELVALDAEELVLERVRLAAALEGARAAQVGARDEERQAESGLELARERHAGLEREEARWLDLFETGHANESQVDANRRAKTEAAIAEEQAQARLARARAEVPSTAARTRELEAQRDLVELRIARCSIVAPFRGHLSGRAPGLGTLAQPGETLGELVDISTLHLVLKVPEDAIAGVRPGQEVEIRLPARPAEARVGRVASVGVRADAASRAFDVEVDVPNDVLLAVGSGGLDDGARVGDALLRDGQFAEAVVRLGRMDDVLAVDRSHFTVRDGRAIAFVWRDGPEGPHAEERELVLGPRIGDQQVVAAGLLAGERLLTAPVAYLTDGTPVVERPGTALPSGGSGEAR